MSVHEIRSTSDYPVKLIYPHPQNPRRDVGDISELTESIKAHGLFQPLTIIKDGPGLPHEDDDGYTVIIGHRRLAAAKAAGLEYVPCILVEMDEREQIATMLLENMQRQDLTVWEQAKGFQLMLDLGETEATIAEKTGFSKATVKHRVKLLELDPDEFRKSQERQVTLSDYIKLEKIEDKEQRSKVLKSAGTSNFNWELESCLRHQRQEKITKEWLDFIDDLFFEFDYDRNREIVKTVYMTRKMTDEDRKELRELAEDEENDYCYTKGDTYLYIMGKERSEPLPDYDEERRKREERVRRIRKVEAQAADLRRQFVKNYTPDKKNLPVLVKALFTLEADVYDLGEETFAEMLGIAVSEDEVYITDMPEFDELLRKCPDKVLLAVCSVSTEDCNLAVHDWYGRPEENQRLNDWYAVLAELGYSLSDGEKALLDGTHECFKEE
ncbi:MAG: ParB/RepB/Spo0J family partition protein [Ruminococcus sp.]|nr:ParB/RepB/Spo0J family partition protein [Ruminococcus sp.]